MSRYADIWDGFEPVVKKISNSSKMMKEFNDYVKKRADIEEYYAKGLKKLSESKFAKGETGVVVDAWFAMAREMDETALKHLELAQTLARDVCGDINSFLKTYSRANDKIISTGSKLTKELANTRIAESRAKDRYYKLASSGNFKLEKQIEKANIEYKKKVEELAVIQQRHYVEMPSVLQDLQSFHEQLLDTLKRGMNIYAETVDSVPPVVGDATKIMKDSILTLDVRSDVSAFLVELQAMTTVRPELVAYTAFGSDDPSYQPTYESNPNRKSTFVNTVFSRPPKMPNRDTDSDTQRDYRNRDSSMPGTESASAAWRCEALYDYEATDQGFLSLQAGDIINVLAEEGEGWLSGTNERGETGIFPGNYVAFI